MGGGGGGNKNLEVTDPGLKFWENVFYLKKRKKGGGGMSFCTEK